MDVWYNGKYGVSFYEYGGELNPLGNFLGHTWKNWGLIPTVRPFVTPPTEKTSEMDVKGINGKADVSTQLLGFPLFNNREGSWTFYLSTNDDYSDYILDNNGNQILDYNGDPLRSITPQTFNQKYSQLLRLLNGKIVSIVLDEDPDHFYKGKVLIEQWVASNDGSLNGLTIKYDLFPYKFKMEETVLSYGPDMAKEYKVLPLDAKYPMIAVPWLLIVQGSSQTPTIANSRVWFDNDELNIHLIAPTASNYNFSAKIGKRVKMIASYGEGYPTSHPTCPVSNFSGNNTVRFRITDLNNKAHQKIQIIYREGCL